MKKVSRGDILDYVTYEERRNELRQQALQAKDLRRIHLGPFMTFLFENTDTVRYQIQEMVRIEKMVKEENIKHEIDTYNELLPKEGELGCTLLIEFEEPHERTEMLSKLVALPKHLYLRLKSGEKSYAQFDARQLNEDKLSAVQFLKFKCFEAPVAIGSDHPEFRDEQELRPEQAQTLLNDLSN